MVFFVTFMALLLGFIMIALLKAHPVEELPGWVEGERVEPAPNVAGLELLEESDEVKAMLLRHMGFANIVRYKIEPEMSGFLVFNPAPLAGGKYIVHFVHRENRIPVGASRVEQLRKVLKRDKTTMKGLLITTGSFTGRAREAAETRPVELVDGVRLRGLLQKHYPEGIGEADDPLPDDLQELDDALDEMNLEQA